MKHDEHTWPLTQQLLGQLIRYHRLKIGLNQSKMAHELGCGRGMLAMIESGKRCPTAEMVQKLEQLTNQSVSDLIRQAYV
jgi:transcriptional regulator with XRE-family HTH domain